MHRMSIDEVHSALFGVLTSVTDEGSAEIIATEVISTHLRKDERMNPVLELIEDIRKALDRGLPKPVTVMEKPAIRILDFHGCPGIIYMPQVIQWAVNTARTQGISATGIRNTGGVHTLSTWVARPAMENCIAIFAWNGGSYTTVPYGGREPFFGTNPMAYAIPTSSRPILLDMATSEIPFMNLMRALREGSRLGERQGLDDEGRPTTDPKQVYDIDRDGSVKLLPMGGGYKGSAIMLLLEVITGALVGAKMSREATDDPLTLEEFGGLYLCMNLASFCDPTEFKQRVTTMAAQIRASQPAHGFKAVRLPGDATFEREAAARKRGWLEISDEPFRALEELVRSRTSR